MSMISTLLLPGVNLLSVTDRCNGRSVNRAPAERAVCRTLRTFPPWSFAPSSTCSYHCLHFSIVVLLPHLHNVTPVSVRPCGYDGKGSSKPAQVQTVDARNETRPALIATAAWSVGIAHRLL